MSLEIIPQPNLSLNDLAREMESGVSVLRSAHVGNARAYNLSVASIGIPMLLVDHNMVAQFPGDGGDNNYLPGSVVTRNEIMPLKVNRVGGLALQTEMIDAKGQKATVAGFHVDSLQAAFPDTPIFTNTDYLRQNENIAGEVVSTITQFMPELLRSMVEADGNVRRLPKNSRGYATLLPTHGILQLNDDPTKERGVLMPNEADIVINFIVEAINSGRQRQIHLSGPDMQNYVFEAENLNCLKRLYELIKVETSFGKKLPENLSVEIVPANHASFATTRQRLPAALRIFEVLRYEQLINERKAQVMRTSTDADSRKQAIAEFTAVKPSMTKLLIEAARDAKEFFVDSRDAPFLSQYDLDDRSGGLKMPVENQTMTMEQLRILGKRLRELRKKAP